MIDATVFVRDLADAVVARRTYPRFPEGLNLGDGEAIQTELVELVAPGLPAGLKAGAGEAAAQQFLRPEGPMLGFLYKGRRLSDGCELVADPAVRVECELGLHVSADGELEAVRPVIEFARPDFAAPSDLTGANLAACNVGADRFLTGSWQPWTGSLDGSIAATHSEDIILKAELTGSLGGPKSAVAWMRSETARRDIALWDRTLVITGPCGLALPLQFGSYKVDFGGLGTLRFGAR